MPVNRKMMANMKKEYGEKKGERVYYAMEMKRKKGKKKGGNAWTNTEKHTKRRD